MWGCVKDVGMCERGGDIQGGRIGDDLSSGPPISNRLFLKYKIPATRGVSKS